MSVSQTTSRSEIRTSPIPQEILEEIETFEDEAKRFHAGETPAEVFKPFRLQHGIYGQRQPDVQMIRIKIPFGGLTANQLRRIAELADTYATGVGHVTTRQDIQFPLRTTPSCRHGHAEAGRGRRHDPRSVCQYGQKRHGVSSGWNLPRRSV